MRKQVLWLVYAAVLSLSACSERGPVLSDTITISVNSINESDVDPQGFAEKDENISNETGNPWGEFIRDAETECEGPPAGFSIVSVFVELDLDRSDIEVMEEVITGPLTVYFSSTQGSDEDAVRVNVASASSVSGAGPVRLGNVTSRASLNVLRERLRGGDFHVGLRAGGITNDKFSMTVKVRLRARAHCE